MYHTGKIKTLGQLYLKLETRGKDGTKRRLSLILFSYLIPGFFIPFILYRQTADSSGFEFSFLTFLFFSLIVAFSIVSEFDNLLISKTEADLFSSLPIDDELIVNAKMYVTWRYVFITAIPLLLPGSIFYYLLLHSIPRALMYYFSGALMVLFLTYILLLIYSFAMRFIKTSRLSTYTLIFQVVMIFLIIISYQFVSYIVTGGPSNEAGSFLAIIQSGKVNRWFMQSWFAFIPAKNNVVPDYQFVLKLVLPIVVVYMSYLSLKMYLMENISHIREKYFLSGSIISDQSGSAKDSSWKEGINRILSRVYLRNNMENASFSLIQSLYRSEKTVRLNIFPMIVIPAGLAIFAFITNQLYSPFYFDSLGPKSVFQVTIFLSVLMVLNTGILGANITNYTGASWIYDAYPLGSRRRFRNGIRKFFNIYMLIPICIILFIIFTFRMSVQYALVHTFYIFACASLYNSLFHIFKKGLPFTKENTLINSIQRLTSLLFPLIFGFIFLVVQQMVYKNLLIAILSILIIITVTFWLNFFAFHRD